MKSPLAKCSHMINMTAREIILNEQDDGMSPNMLTKEREDGVRSLSTSPTENKGDRKLSDSQQTEQTYSKKSSNMSSKHQMDKTLTNQKVDNMKETRILTNQYIGDKKSADALANHHICSKNSKETQLNKQENNIKSTKTPPIEQINKTKSSSKLSIKEISEPSEEDLLHNIRHLDRGYAWLVLSVCTFCTSQLAGFSFSYGILLEAWCTHSTHRVLIREAGSNDTYCGVTGMASAGGLAVCILYAATPLFSYLVSRFSYRVLVIPGYVLLGGAMGLMSLAQNVGVIVLTYGFLAGLASSMIYAPCLCILREFFKQRLSLALTVVICGNAIGCGLYPVLLSLVIERYDLQTAMYATIGVIMPGVLFGLHFVPRVTRQDTVSPWIQRICCTTSSEPTHALKVRPTQDPMSGFHIGYILTLEGSNMPISHNDMDRILAYIIHDPVNLLLVYSSVVAVQDITLTETSSSYGQLSSDQTEETIDYLAPPQNTESSGMNKTVPNEQYMTQGINTAGIEIEVNPELSMKSVTQNNNEANQEPDKKMSTVLQMVASIKALELKISQEGFSRGKLEQFRDNIIVSTQYLQDNKLNKDGLSANSLQVVPSVTTDENPSGKNGQPLSKNNSQLRHMGMGLFLDSSHAYPPPLGAGSWNQGSVVSQQEQRVRKKSKFERWALRTYMNIDLSIVRRQSYLLYAASVILYSIGYYVPIYFTPLNTAVLGESKLVGASLLASLAISKLIGDLAIGRVINHVSVIAVHTSSLVPAGIVTCLVSVLHHRAYQVIYCIAYGILAGFHSLRYLAIIKNASLDQLHCATVMLEIAQGLAILTGLSVAGTVYDSTRNAGHVYILTGVCLILSAVPAAFLLERPIFMPHKGRPNESILTFTTIAKVIRGQKRLLMAKSPSRPKTLHDSLAKLKTAAGLGKTKTQRNKQPSDSSESGTIGKVNSCTCVESTIF